VHEQMRAVQRHPKWLVLGFLAVLCASMVFVNPGRAGAQPVNICGVAYADNPTLTTNPGTVSAGQQITINGTGFPPNSEVPLSVGGVQIGVAQTDANGNFSFPYVVPAGTPNGTLAVTALCGDVTVSSNVNVVSAATTSTSIRVTTTISGGGTAGGSTAGGSSSSGSSSGNLPSTGADTLRLLSVAVALIMAGGLIVLAVRKRNSRAAA
jgi:LPXTG-motif cell wall-anchored protein